MGICQKCGNDAGTMHSPVGTCMSPVKPGLPKEVLHDPTIVPLTRSWTPEQKEQVDGWVQQRAAQVAASINALAPGIKALDERPRQVWSEQQPNVFFEYVAQAMLEDLIHELQLRV